MFSSTPKNDGKNSPNSSARNADSTSEFKPDRPAERRVFYGRGVPHGVEQAFMKLNT
jgi:hypothetical protein